MQVQILSEVLSFVGGVISVLTPISYKEYLRRRRERRSPEKSGPLSKAVLSFLDLPEGARKKIEQSRFIRVDGTGDELMGLVEAAKRQGRERSSILAVCGAKGKFSREYYEGNFASCERVKRVFSYDAIHDEIVSKCQRYALEGLRMHLDMLQDPICEVEVVLYPEGKRIRDMGGGTFDPPLSFGLAVLLDGNGSPTMAIVHWEEGAKTLKHLLSIEGMVVDDGQKQLLAKLKKLQERIAGCDFALSSSRKDQLPKILEARDRLEALWAERCEP